MAEEDVFGQCPQYLDPEFSDKKLGLGKFSDVLSQRSLSTSTPCVPRNLHAAKVDDDSGYSGTITDSAQSTKHSRFFIDGETDSSGHGSIDIGENRSNIASFPRQPIPRINLYSQSLEFSADSDFENEIRDQVELPNNSRLEDSCLTTTDIEDSLTEGSSTSDSSFNASRLADQFSEVLKYFSPSESDRLIGRKVLLEHVDIISELASMNLEHFILKYLQPQDLFRMCHVSHQWKRVCQKNTDASHRMRQFQRVRQRANKAVGKENLLFRKASQPPRGLTSPRTSPLKAMQPTGKGRKLSCDNTGKLFKSKKHMDKRQLFQQAAESLQNDQSLCFCRRCSHPAKVDPTQQRAVCFNKHCLFDFCIRCSLPFHGSAPCVPVSVKKTKADIVGSKKSKKNLQRLSRIV